MSRVLKIDPEFQNKIPPLTDMEYAQLEENILDAGKVLEPICVWNDTIVDGHNRYRIILAHPFLEWSVREMNFADKWEAFDWMYKNQLGRRNLTDEQKTFIIGKMYEARKHKHGGDHGNQYTKVATDQNDKLADNKQSWVVNQIAQEQKVGPATVKRAEDYAIGIDVIRKEEPELAESILKAEKKVPKANVIAIAKANQEEQNEMIQEIKDRGTIRKRSKNTSTKEIGNIVETMSDDTSIMYTIHMMREQIRLNAETFIRSLSNLLKDHSDIYAENMTAVNEEIDNIISKINQLKGDIE